MTELLYEPPQEVDAESRLPIGPQVATHAAAMPGGEVLAGRFCRLEPLSLAHGDALYAASTPSDAVQRFRYLPNPAPRSRAEFDRWLEDAIASPDAVFYAVIDQATDEVGGRQAFMRIAPQQRSIEIGNVYWGPGIARSPITTEANYLFARHAFDTLGYRRFEWKCDALNAPSRRAALRFGFMFEGQFRRAVIVRGRTRDTAWYSIIEEDWVYLKPAYEAWLQPDNFDAAGVQRQNLQSFVIAHAAQAK